MKKNLETQKGKRVGVLNPPNMCGAERRLTLHGLAQALATLPAMFL